MGGDAGAQAIVARLREGAVVPEYVLDEGGAVTFGLLPGFATPVGVVGIAEKGSVGLELTVHVEGGHSSAPPPQTAIGIISTAVHNVETHPMPAALRRCLAPLASQVH